MEFLANIFILVPVLPLLAAAVIAVTPKAGRQRAATLSIGSMGLACVIAVLSFFAVVAHPEEHIVRNFDWLRFGDVTLQLGWVLDPLSAAMAAMVTFVGSLIFIFSLGYMEHDENFTRFFGFLSLFAAAMLGLVVANNLLLLFVGWELVGLTSYLLIGFWFHKPEAAAAAKKAFITTRIGDIGFLLGMVWWYAKTGTLSFYDGGQGCLEAASLDALGAAGLAGFLAPATLISLLLFCGAVGKSGQVPLHVWLPDAMEGPTPVSALIHAATMVAAGVFLMARIYPLLEVGANPAGVTPALIVVAWVGAITALVAAFIAVAQNDIKRILAYSTVSQLGYMFLGLGVGGVAVGMFHLLTHAFFKALLFLGSGSVIHGCHEEQDIRHMGGLKKYMPITFLTYAVGMMALAGVPVFFSGFWSKDEILHAAHGWTVSSGPFWCGLLGAVLTAFYMTRQVATVFFGEYRGKAAAAGHGAEHGHAGQPHESPPVMTRPLVILAVFAVVLGFFGTPAWPWMQEFIEGEVAHFELGHLFSGEVLGLMFFSTLAVAAGLGTGWWLYGVTPRRRADDPDPLETRMPGPFRALQNRLYFDEFYEATIIRFNAGAARVCDLLDRWVVGGLVMAVSYCFVGFAWAGRFIEEKAVNAGFDAGCETIRRRGAAGARLQDGRVHNYLRALGVGFATLLLLLSWGCQ